MSGDLGDPGQEPQDTPQRPDLSLPADLSRDQLDDHADWPPELGPAEALLRPGVQVLPVPSGSFERIRRRATRRRRVRAVAGCGLAAAVVVGGLSLAGLPGSIWHTTTPPITATGGTFGPAASSSPPPSRGTPRPTPSAAATGPVAVASASSAPSAAETSGGAIPDSSPTPGSGATSIPTSAGGSGSTGLVATCATSQLTAALGGSDAGAGNLYRYLVLTNHGSTQCALEGFPGLSLLTASGGQLGAPATFDHSLSYSQVVLQPGASASDTIHTLNAGATSCSGTSTSLRIYPPSNRAALVIPGQVMLCGGQLSVSPFIAGTTGNPPQ